MVSVEAFKRSFPSMDELPTLDECSNMILQQGSGLGSENETETDNLLQSPSWLSSTKIDRMIDRLNRVRQEEPDAKTIVFSQFTGMLDLLEGPLRSAGYKLSRYDGSMNRTDRETAVNRIMQDDATTVMLVSLKCGGLGLNLTRASHVILMDIWWNPSIEDQAIDRVHRIGQAREVSVERMIIKGTVEERIANLQDKKRALAAGTLGEEGAKIGRLPKDDLVYLFQ